MLDLECQLLNSIIPSNEHHIDLSIEMVERTGKKRVGILGLSFKAGTDDLRESPAVRLAETLFGKGYEIAIFDENVDISRLVGANRTFIDRELPHIASLMCASIEETVRRSEVVVVTNWSKAFRRAVSLMNADQVLIDLVGVVKRETDVCVPYEGSGW
jgi:GDP-mannose 6-dehydrogenase